MSELTEFDAYWIDPHGRISGIPYRHINHIVSDPEKYGLTAKYIKDIHKKYKERLGQEGNAREEIMIELMKRGWTRVRKIVTGSVTWTIQCWVLNSTITKHILGWIFEMAKEKAISKNTEINISDVKTGGMLSSTAGKAVQNLGENLKKKKKKVISN